MFAELIQIHAGFVEWRAHRHVSFTCLENGKWFRLTISNQTSRESLETLIFRTRPKHRFRPLLLWDCIIPTVHVLQYIAVMLYIALYTCWVKRVCEQNSQHDSKWCFEMSNVDLWEFPSITQNCSPCSAIAKLNQEHSM